VTAVMRPVPATQHLEVKFVLLRAKRRFGRFRELQIRNGSLGKWVTPANPTLGELPGDLWEPTGEVADLSAPAYYRLRVGFRWIGKAGVTLSDATLSTPTCFQPELRPYLVVRSVRIGELPNSSADDSYQAVIANRGATPASAFDVALSAGPMTVATKQVPALDPHQVHTVVFEGPACTSGEVITVTADPAHLLDVASRKGSSLAVICR
jgi:hypothetical protein